MAIDVQQNQRPLLSCAFPMPLLQKVLPLRDITVVRKAKTAAVFPNAIEIVAWGKRHFFASFLSRDEAYRLIILNWSMHSGYAKLFLGVSTHAASVLTLEMSSIVVSNLDSDGRADSEPLNYGCLFPATSKAFKQQCKFPHGGCECEVRLKSDLGVV